MPSVRSDRAEEENRKTDCPRDLQRLKGQAQGARNSTELQDSSRQSSTSGSMPVKLESLAKIRGTAHVQAEPRLRRL
jgi:hypothetical protein